MDVIPKLMSVERIFKNLNYKLGNKMDKLKKALMVVAIIAVIAIAGSLVYYFAFSKPEMEKQKLKLEQEKLKIEQEKWEREKERAKQEELLDFLKMLPEPKK